MRAKGNPYHIECFRCNSCMRKLIPGDKYGVDTCVLYCKEHYLSKLNSSSGESIQPSVSDNDWQNNGSPGKHICSYCGNK